MNRAITLAAPMAVPDTQQEVLVRALRVGLQTARSDRARRVLAPHRPRSSSATAPITKPAPTNAPAQSGSSSTVAPITAPTSGVT